jgi:hypothetical protein
MNFLNEAQRRHFFGWKRIVLVINHGNRFTRWTCGVEQKNHMKGKGNKPCIKSHKSDISRSCVGRNPQRDLNEILTTCLHGQRHEFCRVFLLKLTWFEFGEGLNLTFSHA